MFSLSMTANAGEKKPPGEAGGFLCGTKWHEWHRRGVNQLPPRRIRSKNSELLFV
jgi:hypothetical protein